MNIEYEKTLIDLLGYKIKGPDNSNRFLIYDEDDNEVGFIQYKKLHKKSKNNPAIFGYQTKIDSDKVYFESSRKENAKLEGYDFYVKESGNKKYSVLFSANDNSSIINVSCDFQPLVNFYMSNNKIHLILRDTTDNFNIEENVHYNATGYEWFNEYYYQLSYSEKSKELENFDNRTSMIIMGKSGNDDNELEIKEMYYRDGSLKRKSQNLVSGTVDEMVINHHMGIDALNRFKYIANKIMPFKADIWESLISDEAFSKYGLDIFINEENIDKKLVRNKE